MAALIALQLADERFETDLTGSHDLVREAISHAQGALADLRELAAGMHPSLLTNRGLQAAVKALAERSPLPVDVDIPQGRYPQHVEAAAYFVVAEALTNVVKHADATRAQVRIRESDGMLDVEVRDDGKGGASFSGGVQGIQDRVEALGGSLDLDSPAGAGTRLCAVISLAIPDEWTAPQS